MSNNQQPLRAIVKQSLGGGSVVLRGRPGPNGQPAKERTLYLANLSSPRMGSQNRPDEPYAFEAREFLRLLVVGKDVQFTIVFNIPGNVNLEFGTLHVVQQDGQLLDVAQEMIRSGWAKIKEAKSNADSDQDAHRASLKEAEDEARQAKRGLWNTEATPVETRYSPPQSLQSFVDEHKGKQLEAIVEQVTNGSACRVRLMLSPEVHQMLLVSMAGIRCPRSPPSSAAEDTTVSQAEPFGAEARYFAEFRLLQRTVTIELLALPPQTTPNTPVISVISHPAGSIAALLLSYGYAKCLDLHAGFLGASRMAELRTAETNAKQTRRGVWTDVVPTANGHANGSSSKGRGQEAVVTRIWSADSISVRAGKHGEGPERRIVFSSVRQPKLNDEKQAGYQHEGREYLRKRLIGKSVHVSTDYNKPKDGDFDARECCTVTTSNGKNIAEEMAERGLLAVIKHRRDDQDKSSEIDKLMQAEQKAQSETKGIHSGKDSPAPRHGDASESLTKATSFLAGFKRAGRIPVVVDFISSASRFKVLLPKQGTKLTLVLAGIRAPRTARNQNEKGDAYGQEALDFVSRKATQRDAEIEIDSTDKVGGFIGTLYLNKTENLAISLAKEGFASVSEYGLDRLSWSKDLLAAEAEAKEQRKHYTEQAAEPAGPAIAASKSYLDVLVSDIRQDPFGFSVQVTKDGGIPELESLMRDFSLHHKAPPSTNAFVPRSGDLVSARYSLDNQWYRARVLASNPSKKQASLVFIDYGNQESLPFAELRPLDAQFRKLEGQARPAVLSMVKLPANNTEYAQDAFDLFRSLTEGRSLVANIDFREAGPNGVSHLTLFDPQDAAARDENGSINASLVREGLASVDKRSKLRDAYSTNFKALQKASEEAHRSRKGIFEFGDVTED